MANSSYSAFAQYAREHGFASIGALPAIAKKLSGKADRVAPNSPMLEELATFMKRPLSELQAFARGKPMSEQFLNKIKSQIERGTIPKGKQVWTKKRREAKARGAKHNPPTYAKNPLGKLIKERGISASELAEKIGAKTTLLWKASTGLLAPNHPVLARIAEELDVPVAQLAKMQRGRPIEGHWLESAEKRFGTAHNGHKSHDHKPGKAVVLSTVEHGPGANGKHVATRGYNRLGSKRSELQLRQSARAMIATLNVAIMQGATHMPPLPVEDLYLILQDYVQEKGIRAAVLIDPMFAQLFDPK